MQYRLKKGELRECRGETTALSELPDDVVSAIHAIQGAFGDIFLWGSYFRGDWGDSSDLDIAIADYDYATCRATVDDLEKELGIKIDVRKYYDGLQGLWLRVSVHN